MQLTLSKDLLSHAFQLVSGAVPSRTQREILKNIKLTIVDGHPVLMATDGEVGLRYRMDVATDQVGSLLLPVQRFGAILKEVTAPTITLKRDGFTLEVTAGNSRFRLPMESAGDFPEVPAFEAKDGYQLGAGVLKQAVKQVAFACDAESLRFALSGVLLELNGQNSALVATDGRRLSVKALTLVRPESELEEIREVIPRKAMQLLSQSLAGGEGTVSVSVDKTNWMFGVGGLTLTSRMMDGSFPNYRGVIPEKPSITIALAVGPFLNAVRQASIVTSEESRGVRFVFGQGQLVLHSQAADVGTSSVPLPVPFEGDLEVHMDPRFLVEYLRTLEPESEISLQMTDDESPVLFCSGDDHQYVVMPLAKD